jgi:hypothetical protein
VRSLRFIAEHKDHREPSLGRRAATEGAPPIIVTREVTRAQRTPQHRNAGSVGGIFRPVARRARQARPLS